MGIPTCQGAQSTVSSHSLSAMQAAAAAVLLMSPVNGAALAGEFDLLAEGTPSTYVLDDANVLNKTTKKSVSDALSQLEVSAALRVCPTAHNLHSTPLVTAALRFLFTLACTLVHCPLPSCYWPIAHMIPSAAPLSHTPHTITCTFV